jgi:hypothetical protein
MTRQQAAHFVEGTTLMTIVLASQACAPAFTDARMVGKGRVEVTPHVSAAGFTERGESEHAVNNFGVLIVGGVHDRVDAGAMFVRTQSAGGNGGINFVGFGPRFGLYDRRSGGPKLALATPIAFAFGPDIVTSDSFHLSPALLATFPVSDCVDLNPSARVIVPLCEGCDGLLGFNIGAGIGPADRRVRLRPEFGIIVNPGQEGVVWTFGAGVSLRP